MNKKVIILVVSIVLVTLLILSNMDKAECCANYKKITFDQMYEQIEVNDDYIIVDVRTQEEYENGHIKESTLIPDYEIEKISEIVKDKEKTIYVYCRSGNRSKNATDKLLEMGYTNVYDVGGINTYEGILEE